MLSVGFPARVKKGRDGFHMVTFRDVPEAMTDDREIDAAMLSAADALTAALAGYVKEGRRLPPPSKPRPGETVIHADPSFSAKVALRQLMAERNISNVGLAKLLKLHEKEIRRMVDPDQPTKLDRLDMALRALGYRVIVGIQPVAPSKQTGRESKGHHLANITM
jgi:antitoxin HicB